MRKIGYIATAAACAMLASGVAHYGAKGTVKTEKEVTCINTFPEDGKLYGQFGREIPKTNAELHAVGTIADASMDFKYSNKFTIPIKSEYVEGKVYNVDVFSPSIGDDREAFSGIEKSTN